MPDPGLCRHWQLPLPPGTVLCPQCGHREPTERAVPSARRLVLIGLALILLSPIVWLAVCFTFYGGESSEPRRV
jgi:hypothetical protein